MRLIDADALDERKFIGVATWTPTEATSWQRGWNDAIQTIMECQPTVEKHGHWDNKIIDARYDVPHTVARCSNCKGKIWVYAENYEVKYPYCPMCGCKMDEVTE